METIMILGIVLMLLTIALWGSVFRKKGTFIQLLPFPFKFIGFVILVAGMGMMLYFNDVYTVFFHYFSIIGGLTASLSKEKRENEKPYGRIRKMVLWNTLKYGLLVILILGLVNITFFTPNEDNTPSAILVFVLVYLVEFHRKKRKLKAE